MASRSNRKKPSVETVTVSRRRYPVIDEVRVRGCKYLLLLQLAGKRKKFLAWRPSAAPGGQLCTFINLPNSDSTAQHLQVLARLPSTNNLPTIIDYKRRRTHTDLVLTWVEGVGLDGYLDRIRRNKVARPTPFEAVRVVRGLAHGLRTLNHHAQLIHGDVKPANLILTRKPARLSMIDFGSAWPIERSGFRADGDGLTRVYASPEQLVGGGVVDHRSDQFAASVVLYQLLTLNVPYKGFGGKAGLFQFRSKMEKTLSPPSRSGMVTGGISRRLRKEIDRVVSTGLQLDAGERFLTTSAWLNAIDSVFIRMQMAGKRT